VEMWHIPSGPSSSIRYTVWLVSFTEIPPYPLCPYTQLSGAGNLA
jgi:hypothetical protein